MAYPPSYAFLNISFELTNGIKFPPCEMWQKPSFISITL
jgi:hypothetical protein